MNRPIVLRAIFEDISHSYVNPVCKTILMFIVHLIPNSLHFSIYVLWMRYIDLCIYDHVVYIFFFFCQLLLTITQSAGLWVDRFVMPFCGSEMQRGLLIN